MHKTLLVLLTDDTQTLMMDRHWTHYEKAGCDILVIYRFKQKMVLPMNAQIVGAKAIGVAGYPPHGKLPERILDTLSYCLNAEHLRIYNHFCLIEPDCIFVKPISEIVHYGGMVTTFAGGRSAGFKAEMFYHPPYWMDRGFAEQIVYHGLNMVLANDMEGGWPDRFMGWLIQKSYLKQFVTKADTYTQNAIDNIQKIREARQAIENGAWMIHGVKNQATLDAILI